ncbi:protein IWS1 homolog A-like [Anopheles marshallii]|uniref:protein IWS1 homolog A-like n=1 Tax=Anopheles marshallii TaxID=1521116 RepID=UPI00237C221E|nr:protein IWS1 homolog A-like [Anopheles marshallii]
MKINKKGKSRRKRSKAGSSGSQNEATKSIETQRLRRESRALNSLPKDNVSVLNHDEPNIIETRSQTSDRKLRSQRSNLVKIRKQQYRCNSLVRSMCAFSITSDSENYIQEPKQLEGSSDEKKVNSQTEQELSGDSVKNVKKKRRTNIIHSNDQGSLKDQSTCAKPGASDSGKYIRDRKGSPGVTIKVLEKRLLRSRKGNILKQKHNEPNIKTITQTAHSKKRTHRSSLVKVRKKSSLVRSKSAKMQATGSGKYNQQRILMDDSNDDNEVNIQPDSEASGDSVRNMKKKRAGKLVQKDGQDVLNDDSTSVKSSASSSGKSIQKRKRSNDPRDDAKVSIKDKSDFSGGFVKHEKKKRRANIVHGDYQGALNDISTSAKPGASDAGKYIRHRNGMCDDELANIQPDLNALDVSDVAGNIKKEKQKRSGNTVHGDDQDVHEDSMSLGRGKFVKQRNRCDDLNDEKKFSIPINSDASGGTEENVKETKKILYVLVQDILADGFTSVKLRASGGGKYIQQRKRSDDSSDAAKVRSHTDSDAVDSSTKNVTKKNDKLGGTVVHGDGQDALNVDSAPATARASDNGKNIRLRKRNNDSANEEEVSIHTSLDLSSGSVERINKKKKKRGEKYVHRDDQFIPDVGFTSAKPSASDGGKYTKRKKRKRSCDSRNEAEICIQTVSDSSGGSETNIKKKKNANIVHGDQKDILEDRPSSACASDSREYTQQQNLNDDLIDEEEIIMQHQNMQKTDEETNTVHCDDLNILHNDSKSGQFLSDFDFMTARKKAENAHRRKRNHDGDTYDSEALMALLDQMKQAAIQDRQLNLDGKPATKKIAILHKVMKQLIKKDLQPILLSHNVLHVLAEWISPLPNKALPCLQIRQCILKLLADFPSIETPYLKQSGIGKAVMYLYKHPKEIKANRAQASVLISRWFRSVYNISTDFNGMSRDERRQHDLRQLPKQIKPSTPDAVPSKQVVRSDFWLFDTHKNTIRPGEKGWVSRARVPMPSDKVYIVRPKSNIETNVISNMRKKQPNRYEMYLKKFNGYKRKNTIRSPVQLAITDEKKMCDY